MDHGGVLKHVRVREYLRALAARNAPGWLVPSERELAQHFGVARMTVRQAIDSLVAEGLLKRRPGSGTYVARPRRGVNPVVSFTEETSRRGALAESSTLLSRREQAGPSLARILGIDAGASVVHWRRLRTADGEPVAVQDAYVSEALVLGLLAGELPDSLYAELAARGLRPTWAEDAVTADAAPAEEAELLGIEPGAPVLRHQRRTLSGDTVVEVSRSVYRADRYTLRSYFSG